MSQDIEQGQETQQHRGPSAQANPWLQAARSVPAPPDTAAQTAAGEDTEPKDPAPAMLPTQESAVLVAAHGGAGATAWSHILGAVDGGNVNHWAADRQEAAAPVVLVLRASIEGIAAARNALALHGADPFSAALVVPAGPGRAPRRINHELRILTGALPTVQAPWVPGLLLKRAAHTAPSDIPAKELIKLTMTLTSRGVPTQGGTK